MHRFFVTTLCVAESDAPDYKPLYEETFLLVSAISESDARRLAEKHGVQSAPDYKSVTGNQVKWRFLEVVDVTLCLDEKLDRDVVELHGRFLRDIESYDRLRNIED
ncbi:MAG: DUF4288 domain-containing protein [Parvularculaceae bacterium]